MPEPHRPDAHRAGLFFLLYMTLGGLQDELDEILGHWTQLNIRRCEDLEKRGLMTDAGRRAMPQCKSSE